MATHNDDESPQTPKAIKLLSLQADENAATQQQEEMKEVPLSEVYKKRNDSEAADQLKEEVPIIKEEKNDCEAADQLEEEVLVMEEKNDREAADQLQEEEPIIKEGKNDCEAADQLQEEVLVMEEKNDREAADQLQKEVLVMEEKNDREAVDLLQEEELIIKEEKNDHEAADQLQEEEPIIKEEKNDHEAADQLEEEEPIIKEEKNDHEAADQLVEVQIMKKKKKERKGADQLGEVQIMKKKKKDHKGAEQLGEVQIMKEKKKDRKAAEKLIQKEDRKAADQLIPEEKEKDCNVADQLIPEEKEKDHKAADQLIPEEKEKDRKVADQLIPEEKEKDRNVADQLIPKEKEKAADQLIPKEKEKAADQLIPKEKEKAADQLIPKEKEKAADQLIPKENEKAADQLIPKENEKAADQLIPKEKEKDHKAADQLQAKQPIIKERKDCEVVRVVPLMNQANENCKEIPNMNGSVLKYEEVTECNTTHEVHSMALNITDATSYHEERLKTTETVSNSKQKEPKNRSAHRKEVPKVVKKERKRKEKFIDPVTYLPSNYDSLGYRCCQSCTCDCPSCCGCLAFLNCAKCQHCADCAESMQLPDTMSIRKARQIGVTLLSNTILRNLFHIAVLREIIVYIALISTLVSLGTSAKELYDATQSEERQIGKTLTYISFGVTMFGLPFTILDGIIRFRHRGCRVAKRVWKKEELDQEGDEKNAEYCNDSCACEGICGKSCTVFMDITRILVLETIFYPDLLLQVFQFIMLLVDNNYAPKMIPAMEWFTAVKGLLSILVLDYLHKAYVFGNTIVSIHKFGKKHISKKPSGSHFITLFVLYVYGLMILQILMIIIIGARFHYEYVDNRAIEMSVQLWYMIIFAYIMPFLGMLMYFFVHFCWTMTVPVDFLYDLFKKMQTNGEESIKIKKTRNEAGEVFQSDESIKIKEARIEVGEEFESDYHRLKEFQFWKKFVYPFISPLHAPLIGFYGLLFSGFFLCCTLDAPYGIWTWFYVAAGGLTVILNIYATSITFVWIIVLIGIAAAIAAVTAVSIAIIALIIAFFIVIILLICVCMHCSDSK